MTDALVCFRVTTTATNYEFNPFYGSFIENEDEKKKPLTSKNCSHFSFLAMKNWMNEAESGRNATREGLFSIKLFVNEAEDSV